MNGYIYKINNLINNKSYIGKTINSISERFNQHINCVNKHINRYLYDAMNNYGIDNFSIEQLEECDESILNERERYWIDFYQSNIKAHGYNMTCGGDGGNTYSNLPEDKKKWMSENLSSKLAGRKQSPETVARRVEKLKGKIRTPEQRQRMSEAAKHRDPNTRLRGYTLSQEQKDRISKTLTGRKQSEETKQKRNESLSKLRWFNNGIESIRAEICPEGFIEGRLSFMSQEAKLKCSQQGKKWYTNGITNKMAFECPEGYRLGRTKK